MSDVISEAELWEQGSRSDRLRNEFVIPALAHLLTLSSVSQVLDVGAGTGYVAREVDGQLPFRAHWTLLDTSRDRLELAEKLRPGSMIMNTVVADIFTWPDGGGSFDAILLSFTLLEIQAVGRLIEIFGHKLAAGALLLVVLPDAWVDVIRHSKSDPAVLERFLSQSVDVPKVDKFTETQYPFHAMRTESLIEVATEKGFDLFSLRHGVIGSAAAYVLGFRRRTPSS